MARPKPTGPFERVPVSYKLPRWLADWLRDADRPATRLVADALCQAYNLTPPVDPAEVDQLRREQQRIQERLEELGVTDD